MTWPKLLIVMMLLSLGSAALVGFVSRTPAAVRADAIAAAAGTPEAHDPSLGSTFTDEQVSRHAAYRGPAYLGLLFATVLPLLLLILLTKGPFGELVDRIGAWRGGWVVHATLAALAIGAVTTLVMLPLGLVRGYFIAKAWGLSTQNLGGWLSDLVRSFGVGGVIAAVSAIAFFGVVRWQPRTWWLWGWGTFTVLTVALVFLYPVAIAPLFNRFTSLEAGPLRERILALGDEAGVPLDDVLVADASKRTTTENAYVAGLGSTKQMVLFDTLLENGREDETVFIAAHELGHKMENHVVKNVLISSAGLLFGFGLLYLLVRRGSIQDWAGAESLSDLRVLPVLLLYMTALTLLTLPLQNAVSRSFEGRADEIAAELTDAPEPGVRVFRRLAFSNLADLRPPKLAVWLLYTHPPLGDRIETLLER
jgi:STE24 endopeptidase